MKKLFVFVALILTVSFVFTGCFWPISSHAPSDTGSGSDQTSGGDSGSSTGDNTSTGGGDHSSGGSDATSGDASSGASSTDTTSQGVKLSWNDIKSAVYVPDAIKDMFNVLDILLPENAKLTMVSFNSMQAPRRYLHLRFTDCGSISKEKYEDAKAYLDKKGYANVSMNFNDYGGSLSVSDSKNNVYLELANDPSGGDMTISIGYKDDDVNNPSLFGIDFSKLGSEFDVATEIFKTAGVDTTKPTAGKGHYEVLSILPQDNQLTVEYNITTTDPSQASQKVKAIASLVGGDLSGMGSVLMMEEKKYKGWIVETGAQDKLFEITLTR